MDTLFNSAFGYIASFVAIVIAITIHEFSHAYAAERLGDPTPRLMGRLTLNPLKHLDPIGTLLIIIARFGWGKPVIFDPFNLRNPKRDSAIISIAGPISNLLLALAGSLLLQFLLTIRLTALSDPTFGTMLILGLLFLRALIQINVILAIFNLVPIHPLDGFKIVGGILPDEYSRQWNELEPYGMIFLLFLVFPLLGRTPPIQSIIGPPINFLLNILLPSAPLV